MCRARQTCPFSDRLHAARLQEPGSALGPGTLRARVCSSGLPGANRGIQKHAQLLMETAGKAQFLIAGPIGLTAAAEPVRANTVSPTTDFCCDAKSRGVLQSTGKKPWAMRVVGASPWDGASLALVMLVSRVAARVS
jgi:hypothetical protein